MKHFPALAMLASSSALVAPPLPRAIAGVRADANDPAVLIGQINAAVTAMRNKQDELAAKVDPLDIAQIAAMNESIGTMQASLDSLNTQMAAARLGQGNGPAQPRTRNIRRRSTRTSVATRSARPCRSARTPTAATPRRSNGIARSPIG